MDIFGFRHTFRYGYSPWWPCLVDPVVANHTMTFTAVMAGTIIGSQAPDVDTVLKLRNNAIYIRHHRGITHSLPAVAIWPILITLVLAFIIQDANVFHLWLWTFLAVALHVFVDIFNAYGTQAIRPFSRKWVALGVINTFDPIIFFPYIVLAYYFGHLVQTLFGHLASCILLLWATIFYALQHKEP